MRTVGVRGLPAWSSNVSVDGTDVILSDGHFMQDVDMSRRLLLRMLPLAHPHHVQRIDITTACQSIGRLYAHTVQNNCQWLLRINVTAGCCASKSRTTVEWVLRIKVTAAQGINTLRLRMLL
jgi:hypothetical protein